MSGRRVKARFLSVLGSSDFAVDVLFMSDAYGLAVPYPTRLFVAINCTFLTITDVARTGDLIKHVGYPNENRDSRS